MHSIIIITMSQVIDFLSQFSGRCLALFFGLRLGRVGSLVVEAGLVGTHGGENALSKDEILEIYLNNVEWGAGIFGAEAAAQHYYRKSARQLTAPEAARLAVMLPAPKRFEKTPNSAYLAGRTRTIMARMASAELP